MVYEVCERLRGVWWQEESGCRKRRDAPLYPRFTLWWLLNLMPQGKFPNKALSGTRVIALDNAYLDMLLHFESTRERFAPVECA
jgi:hypothetical protein